MIDRSPAHRMIVAAHVRDDADVFPADVLATLGSGYGVTAAAMEQWLASAPAGAQLAYAQGFDLPQSLAAVVMAREAAGAGLVHLKRHKVMEIKAGRRVQVWYHWLIEKRPVLAGITADQSDSMAGMIGADAQAVYRRFRRAALLEEVAPTNGELAQELNLKNAERARYVVRKLKDAGLIVIADDGPRRRRIVTVAASGRSTRAGAL